MLSLATATAREFTGLAMQIADHCRGYSSHEEVSRCVTRSLYESFGPEDNPEIALVRIYRLVPTAHLPAELRALVDENERYVMALTGTYGMVESWQDRRMSASHKVIPIRQVTIRGLMPMFENVLLNGLKVDIDRLYATGDVITSTQGFAGMFYIGDVAASPAHIPAQDDFVIPYGIKSEFGYGGVIAGGGESLSLYTMFIFTRVPVSEETAKAFFETRPILGTELATRIGQTVFAE